MNNIATTEHPPENPITLAKRGRRPELPDPLPRLIGMGTTSDLRFPEDGSAYEVRRMKPGWQPPPLKSETETLARQTLAALDAYLAPGPITETAARIVVMREHFYVPDRPESMAEKVDGDWLDALAEYPAWAVNQAAKDWIATEARRPAPSAIKARCERLVKEARHERAIIAKALDHHERSTTPAAAKANAMIADLASRMQMNPNG